MGETLPGSQTRRISRVRIAAYTVLLLACLGVVVGALVAVALGLDWIVEHLAASVQPDGS